MRLPRPGERWECNEGSATIVVVGAGLTFAGEGSVRQRVYFVWRADSGSCKIQQDSCSVGSFLDTFKPLEPEAEPEREPCAECESLYAAVKQLRKNACEIAQKHRDLKRTIRDLVNES